MTGRLRGIVKSIARPDGNTTGVTNRYNSISGKLVELLKQAVPGLERVALIYNRQIVEDNNPQLLSIEQAARVFALAVVKLRFLNAVELVHGIDAFAAQPNGGLIILAPPPSFENRETIFQLATQHRLPTISGSSFIESGLMTYNADDVDLIRRAASYVDRILRGAKPGDLPVEFPTKFELVVNLKTAKAIGLTIPESFLLRADRLIE